MKKLVLSLFLIISSVVVNGQDLKIIKTDIFTVGYSEALEQPVWVEYKVLCPNGEAERTGMDFWIPEGVHTSDDADYAANVWDKGHMAPASAFSCDKETLKKTFSYLNSALQHESLNRGVWNRLEAFERDLGNFYDVNVRIDVIFDETSEVLPTGATVPTSFKKTIKFGDKEVSFLFPNEAISGKRWIDFIIN